MRSVVAVSLATLLASGAAFAQSGQMHHSGQVQGTPSHTSTNINTDARTSAQNAHQAAQRAEQSARQAEEIARTSNAAAAQSAARAAREAANAARDAAQAAHRAALIAHGGSATTAYGTDGRALSGPAVAGAVNCPPGYVYDPGVPGRTIARVAECVPAGNPRAGDPMNQRPAMSPAESQSNTQIRQNNPPMR